MLISDMHMQVATAIPPFAKLRTRKGVTFRADIQTSTERKSAYLKILRVEDIAREALCAVLARKLHLPMLRPYYVHVEPLTIEGNLIGNRDHVGFGLEEDCFATRQIIGHQITDKILKWPDALSCAVFDEWIFNRDRLPSNLLFSENGVYWLIDHDEAFPNYASPAEVAGSSVLSLLSEEKSEFELHELRKNAMLLVQEYKKIDWTEIYKLVKPEVVSGTDTYVARYIRFLQERLPYMRQILTKCLRLRQTEILFESSESSSTRGSDNK